MKKVYFAGSIRGGRDFVDTYHALIDFLNDNYTVLTEHIGDKNLTIDGEVKLTDVEIFNRDCAWIKEADYIVAEVSNPSLGVGYEIGLSEYLKKPIICLYQKSDKKVSAMISGNKKLKLYSYSSIDEAKQIIKDNLT